MAKHSPSDLLFGRNPVIEGLQSGRAVHKLFVQQGLSKGRVDSIIRLAKQHKAEIKHVPKEKLDQLSNGGVHQGVALAVAAKDYSSLDQVFELAESRGEAPFIVLLDEIEDPHNLGSILRTADAVGAHGVVIPKHRAVGLTATVAKAAAGAMEYIPVVRVTNMVDCMKELKERGLWLFGTDAGGEDFRSWNAQGPIGIVIGNEGSGMSRLVREHCDGIVSLPMLGQISSLNASVAAGIIMYEVFRQHHRP